MRVKGSYVASVGSSYRVSARAAVNLNAKSKVDIGAKDVEIRSLREALVHSRGRAAFLADNEVTIGNGKGSLVIKKSGDIILRSVGNISVNGKKIELN